MAREAPVARVELGGKERVLRFDLGAIIDFEDWSGINLMNPETWIEQHGEDPNRTLERRMREPRTVAQFLAALLRHEEPDLEWRTVARWVDVTAMDELMETAFSVYEGGRPEDQETEDDEDPTTREPVTA